MTLDAALRAWATDAPEAKAVVVDDQVVRVGELVAHLDALAAWCATLTEPGDRVAYLGGTSLAALTALYAVPAAGRVLVPLNIRHTPGELAGLIERTGATLLIGDPDRIEPLTTGARTRIVPLDALALGIAPRGRPATRPEAFGDLAAHRVVPAAAHADAAGEADVGSASHAAAEAEAEAAAQAGAHDVNGAHAARAGAAWVIFTSGSTGPPKGVLLTAASLRAAVRTTAAARPLSDDAVYLYPFPLFHVAAYNVLHAHVRRRPVVLPGRFDAAAILDLIERHDVTTTSLAPTMLRMLLDELARSGRPAPASLRAINYGAAAMAEPLLREAVDTLGVDVAQGYGMTELSGNAVFLSPEEHRRGLAGEARLLRSAGRAGPGVRLCLRDEHGEPVPTGEVGEITVAADQVCAGYLDDPEATAAAIRDGWLHTGDIGRLDADGLLTVVDRAKDLVITGGENVASRAVEEALLTHPELAQVAVIGLPDPLWGEAVTAVVVAADGHPRAPGPVDDAFLAELRHEVGRRLAGYAKPRRVIVVDALPINASGKVDKPALRARFAAD